MVYFTCNHCGASLKKNTVDKHYHGQCRNSKFLTCVDCMKDFRGEEYVAHTKCITESEKYSAKGFVSRPSSVKGEVKQLSWLELITHVSENSKDIPPDQQTFLKKLLVHDNVPQKRAKFQNFAKNIGFRTNSTTVDLVWDLLETERNARKEKQSKIEVKLTENDEKSDGIENGMSRKKGKKDKRKKAKLHDTDKDLDATTDLSTKEEEEELVEKKQKKQRKKAKRDKSCIEVQDPASKVETDIMSTKPHKSKKKRGNEDMVVSHHSELVSKKKKLNGENNESNGTDQIKLAKFNWCEVITKALECADEQELSVKRLEKKVLSEFRAYGGYIDATANAIFRKKLSKIPVVLVLKDRAKLKKI